MKGGDDDDDGEAKEEKVTAVLTKDLRAFFQEKAEFQK